MRRVLATLTVLLCTAATTAACGEEGSTDGGGGTTGSETETIEITFSGDSVSPSGERVEVEAGQKLELVVKADAPGELHVHSEPEQELEYASGTTTLPLTIDQPGRVDVESHDLEEVIVQLEVR